MISLVVITLNEEANIARCLESARQVVDEILVVDSFSTDQTVAVARAFGARVLQRPFEGFVQQRDWAIRHAAFDRVLVLDADEALSEHLLSEIRAIRNNWSHNAYLMRRLSRLGDRWIRHGAWYPDWKMRLFDRNAYRISGENPHDRIDPLPGTSVRRIHADILHYTNDSFTNRIETINRFSSLAASSLHLKGRHGSLWRIWFKPKARFIKEYLVQRGFLDGMHGYFIARTSAQYVFYRETKLWEMQQSKSGEPS